MGFAILGLVGYCLYATAATVWRARKRRQSEAILQERLAAQQKLADDRHRAARYAEEQRLRKLNQVMQQGLLQLDQAPDFRRAASFAKRAAAVPIAFRQRQFARFRPKLVQQFAARLTAGDDAAALYPALAELVQALGVARFEADYIQAEAQRQLERPAPRPEVTFAAAMATLQQEHERRKEVLATLDAISPELREQLDEAEEARFREAMFHLQQDPHVRAPQEAHSETEP